MRGGAQARGGGVFPSAKGRGSVSRSEATWALPGLSTAARGAWWKLGRYVPSRGRGPVRLVQGGFRQGHWPRLVLEFLRCPWGLEASLLGWGYVPETGAPTQVPQRRNP